MSNHNVHILSCIKNSVTYVLKFYDGIRVVTYYTSLRHFTRSQWSLISQVKQTRNVNFLTWGHRLQVQPTWPSPALHHFISHNTPASSGPLFYSSPGFDKNTPGPGRHTHTSSCKATSITENSDSGDKCLSHIVPRQCLITQAAATDWFSFSRDVMVRLDCVGAVYFYCQEQIWFEKTNRHVKLWLTRPIV